MKKNMGWATKTGIGKASDLECPLTYALKIIGGKWKLPVLWHLFHGETVRYNELKRSVAGITNMMLSKSLKELEGDGLIERIAYDQIPPKVEYRLAARGLELIPALKSLYEWGDELGAYQQGRKTGAEEISN